MKYKFYAGIGARKTPPDTLRVMVEMAELLARRNWVLRSGGAKGCDTAFESGVYNPNLKEIYLPWAKFEGRVGQEFIDVGSHPLREQALEITLKYHPASDMLSSAGLKFMTRNVFQVLGNDLKTPSLFILCYTEGGVMKGGTSQAIRIALSQGIPVFNLGSETPDKVWDKITKLL